MEHENDLRKWTESAAPFLVEACDELLKRNPNSAIGIIGTAARPVYATMRKLALRLPNRGSHNRVKLLDVSTKLLFGPEHWEAYARFHPNPLDPYPDTFFHRRSQDRSEKLFRYIKESGLLEHGDILLVDEGFNGTVPRNLEAIIKKRHPGKKVGVMVFNRGIYGPAEVPIKGGPYMAEFVTKILEFGKHSLGLRSSTVYVDHDFSETKRGMLVPRYERSDELSRDLAKMKHAIIDRHVREYIARQKRAPAT